MSFSKDKKQRLLKVKYVDETVIRRFEQIGVDYAKSQYPNHKLIRFEINN